MQRPTSYPPPASTATVIAGADVPLALTLWHSWTGAKQQALDLLARRYEQQHPGVRIKLEARPVASLIRDYTTRVADGGAPQLILVQGRYVGELASRQQLVALDDALPATVQAALVPAGLAATEVAGRHYGVPLLLDSLSLIYNRRMISRPPSSLTELLASPVPTTTATTEPPLRLAYYLSSLTALPYLYAAGGQLRTTADAEALGGTGRLPATRWLSGLQQLAAQTGGRISDDLNQVDQALQTGRAASAVVWSSQYEEYAALWGVDMVGLAPLPPATNGAAIPPALIRAEALCVNPVTSPAQRAAALAVVAFMASPEAQATLVQSGHNLPAVSQVPAVEPLRPLQPALAKAIALPPLVDSRTWAVLDETLHSVLTGSAVPEQALDTTVAQLRRPQR